MVPSHYSLCLALLSLARLSHASAPQVDFERMGNVGLAGAFAGLDLFSTSTASFDPSTSTLFARGKDGSLIRLGTTNSGGSIRTGCALNNVLYVAGSFSSINGVSATNVASFDPSTSTFSPVGSNSPNGQVNTLFCDSKEGKLWAGGAFSAPGSSVAIYDPNAGSWSNPPFTGIAGAQARVNSITSAPSDDSLLITGSFIVAFGNGSINGSPNPNLIPSAGASPFSSSLVPVPLQNAEVTGAGSTTAGAGFSNIRNALCPAGPDGSGNTWFGQDNTESVVSIRTFSFIPGRGLRLGNTFQPNRGTTAFSVTTIPDNNVRTLTYVDPATGQNQTCSNPCPLSTDSSVPYQDFLFDGPLDITGVLIRISGYTGIGPGLHTLQILSSGAFVSSIESNNTVSCGAPSASNSTDTGDWTAVIAPTDIPGTIQTVLVSSVPVGSANSATFKWVPYVAASGTYEINLMVPGCNFLSDCDLRTSVKVTVFPGNDLPPFTSTVSQRHRLNTPVTVYSGPILPSSPDFVTTITMELADSPEGTGVNGRYQLVADGVQLVLKSANVSDSDLTSSNGLPGTARAFGFLEWPRKATSATSAFDGRKAFPNNTLTLLDSVGINILSGAGGVSSVASGGLSLNAVALHSTGVIVGGSFSLTSGPASGANNIVVYKNGALAGIADGGLNGAISSLSLLGDLLFVGGNFTDTKAGSTGGKLAGAALYNVAGNSWTPLGGGLNGPVTSINQFDGQIQFVGSFTKIASASGTADIDASGIATWDAKSGAWINSGGFVLGSMTFIGNGTNSQIVAGNVAAARRYGASGLVMLRNGDETGPQVAPLPLSLGSSVAAAPSTGTPSRRSHHNLSRSFMSHITFGNPFSRRQAPQAPLAQPLPATAPAVLAGAFWTNGAKEVVIFGGNFSFVAPGSSTTSLAVAIYDPSSSTASGLNGPQISGIVRTLLVDGKSLYIGGQFTIPGTSANGLAIYNLEKGEWDLTGLQTLQPASGSSVVVRSIKKSTFKPNVLIVGGSFAQAGSLSCPAICSYDTETRRWDTLGSGVTGEVTSVDFGGSKEEILFAAGSLSLSGGAVANVISYSFENSTWTAIGTPSDIPGPISAIEVNGGNTSSLFAAGTANDQSFLTFWNGQKWSTLGANLGQGSTVAQLTMVPLQNTHDANGIVEVDRVLMVSGSLETTEGNASAALFDGQKLIPYIVSSTASGAAGSISALFHSFSTFNFNQRKFLATGVVILISIAIAAGIVFLLALIGILWTLFSRKEDKGVKYDGADMEDDDSIRHRPSSLLEHINAATRTTIIAGAAMSTVSGGSDREEKSQRRDLDPFGPDGSNYLRADTPSEAVGGMMGEETSRPAHARYSFEGTGEGELRLSAGAAVEVLDDHDPAWWYARDVRTGQEGVVPAAYLY